MYAGINTSIVTYARYFSLPFVDKGRDHTLDTSVILPTELRQSHTSAEYAGEQ